MHCLFRGFMLWVLVVGALQAQQHSVSLTPRQLAEHVRQDLPIARQFDDVSVQFQYQSIVLDGLEERLELFLLAHANLASGRAVVRCQFRGTLSFHRGFRTIQFQDPWLFEAALIDSEGLDQEHQQKVLKVVRQSVSTNFPDFTLVDLETLDLRVPREVDVFLDVDPNRLTIEFAKD